MKQHERADEESQELLQRQQSSRNNTHCVVCNLYKRKDSFKVTDKGDVSYSNTCGKCRYDRKRNVKVNAKIG